MLLKTISVPASVLLLCLSGALYAQTDAPLWVLDKNKVFGEKDWVCVVEQASSKSEAQSAAAASLARVFKMDVKSVTNAMQNFSTAGGQFARDRSLSQQVDTSSDVAGLIGVKGDFWEAPDGSWYATARINRHEGAATYSSIIGRNSAAIETLLEDAAGDPGTFRAYGALAFAYELAMLNDNYLNLLSVLDSGARQALKTSYGNAASVRILMQNAAAGIVIAVEVAGDEAGNIRAAFASVFDKRKFKTGRAGADARYTLSAEFTLSEEESPGKTSRVRYLLNAALRDYNGEELLSFTENKRVTSTTRSQAVANAVRDAEKAIGDTGFAKNFDRYLASLLGK
ncbi:MAG: hypothetical protein LBO04_03070 [Spirochaetaceae bacterium]|jgi:hypothetical protein|nr:hypothetical protein [Spirochaetaceae bacterium]